MMKEWRVRYQGTSYHSVRVLAETAEGARLHADQHRKSLVTECDLDSLEFLCAHDIGDTEYRYWAARITLIYDEREFMFDVEVEAKNEIDAESKGADEWDFALYSSHGDIERALTKIDVESPPCGYFGDGTDYKISVSLADSVEDIHQRRTTLKRFLTIALKKCVAADPNGGALCPPDGVGKETAPSGF
ncbi:hypothetical protein ABIE65_005296 [Constrictibacter sp. MBR-5]|jgi:hypothetical protein|uniref:hypothetical protein n=1 Tax=Constrictibacter sp. MBR-5 TaxID=3156467 RepID=UPI003396C86B